MAEPAVWPIPFLISMFIALKGSPVYLYFLIMVKHLVYLGILSKSNIQNRGLAELQPFRLGVNLTSTVSLSEFFTESSIRNSRHLPVLAVNSLSMCIFSFCSFTVMVGSARFSVCCSLLLHLPFMLQL